MYFMFVFRWLVWLLTLGVLFALFIRLFPNLWKWKQDWREFEIMVYEKAKKKYGNAILWKWVQDWGIDCTAIDWKSIIVIQCKAYDKSTIGVQVCRELIGSWFHFYKKYDNVVSIIACYKHTKFSRQAVQYIKSIGIEVWKF